MTNVHPRSRAIAALNDLARQTLLGCRIVLTEGIMVLPDPDRIEIVNRVRSFDAFTPDNDPYGEHDFGAFDCQDRKIYWKFDYYERDSEWGSPDPSDSKQTLRVLTIFLAEEY